MSKKNNLDIKELPKLAKKALSSLRIHIAIIFIVSIMSVFGFLIFQINHLSNAEPSDKKVNEQLSILKRPKIDQDTIDKIQQLEDQNIKVQSLFKSARDNPFEE